MKRQDVMKLGAKERFRYWITERESIRRKKEAGEHRPWTDDEILQSYRFCNVRRMDDKVSRWLYDNWYLPYRNHPQMLVACALARWINEPVSLAPLTEIVFDNPPNALEKMRGELRRIRQIAGKLFNSAYVVRAGGKGSDKIDTVLDSHVQPLIAMVIHPGMRGITDTMQGFHARLSKLYGYGSFMAGQVVADMRHAYEGQWKDRNTWAPIGPGSHRGINRYRGRVLSHPVSQEKFERKLISLMEYCQKKLPSSITSRLEAMDYQNCLCEFDKYERVLWGEGTPKRLYPGSCRG